MRPHLGFRLALLGLLGILALGMLFSGYRAYQERRARELLDRINARIRVEVLNGTEIPRLGLAVARFLRKQGFDVVYIGNADTTTEITRIVERASPDLRHARALARKLRCGKLTGALDPDRLLEVSLIVGKDYRRCFPDIDPRNPWLSERF